jgi:signal transduction histidine kinase/ligand-binding sensor domain-containing protein/CheY-like chemotaxis protein/HPt (histidine-containing phosphotransfer) domain-containing protein
VVVSITTPTGAWRASLIIIGWMFGASIAIAVDAPPLIVEHVTTADGLPQGTVMATLQDSQGFVWLGTEDGLVRYDGRQLYRYAATRGMGSGSHSLSGNFIWDIVEDPSKDLWLAVKDGGVARWRRGSDSFTTYRHDPSNPHSLASDSVRVVLMDRSGLLFVGTSDAGVDILDPASGQVEHLRSLDGQHKSQHDGQHRGLSGDKIFTLAPARSGDIWIGTHGGLDLWRQSSRGVTHFGPPAGAAGSLVGKQVSRVLETGDGTVWVGTFDAGLVHLDRDGRLLEAFRHGEQSDSLSSNEVRALLEDRGGRLWVGTADGLELLDRSSGRFTHFQRIDSSADSLRDSYIMSLYEDQAGLIWIGTRSGGVSRWNPRSWELGGQRPKWLGSGPVTAFADARDGRVWIASLGSDLMQFDTKTSEVTPLATVLGQIRGLDQERVMSLRQDHLGTLWIGTMSAGLKRLGRDGRLESIAVKAGDARSTSAAGIMTIVETRGGQIWIGTFGGGANAINPATGVIRQLPFGADQPGAISAAEVTAIAEDSRGNLWIGTMGGGLNLAGGDGHVRKVFRHRLDDVTSLPASSIYAVTVDAQDRVWIGTEGGGLAQVVGSPDAPESIHFKTWTRAQGLTSDTVYGIEVDAAGNLWLSGNAGLMRFDPARGAIKAYHREHGLQGEEFAFGASHRLADGRICFGGPGGFNIFDPARLTENRQPPRVALTNVEVLGARMRSGTPFWLLGNIPLGYRDSIVSLDFGVLDFASLEYNRLAYRMPGLTDQWIDLGSERRITLTTLPAGEYVLEVRAASSDSQWSPQPLRLTIQRDPAPWKSGWAYAAYALVLLSLIVYRARQQRRKFRELAEQRARLETEVELRTRELVESNRQLAEAARAKSDFLDRMSHELRTPMNGVVGMTELLSRTALSATQSHLTKTIRSSAQILLQIVSDLLDLSKIRAGKVALEKLPIDLGQVLEECTSLFAGAAESKGIELIVCPPSHGDCLLLGDPLRARQIVMNLVGNAVKFTSKGEVVVRADVHVSAPDRAVAKISVTDTGIGMDAEAVERIFEPFSQADETTTRRFGGTGLGLAICRELADIMHGTITVESTPQVGSTFHLSLPLEVANQAPTQEISLSQTTVRIVTRRPSLRESLSRHLASFGLVAADEICSSTADDAIFVIDVSTQAEELHRKLAVRASREKLVVLATAAEAQAHDLRTVLDERMIVLKPIHRIALGEALAAAVGVRLAPTATSKDEPSTTPALKGHVLLVEDDAVNATVAEGYLAVMGCSCVWVKRGSDAVARSAAEHFDLVLMDLNMPDMDGFTATRLIRQREGQGRHVPIVALTAHDASSYRDKCQRADMDDILSKPYTLDDCARLLQRWLAHEPAQKPTHEPTREPTRELEAAAQVVALPVASSKQDSLSSIDAATVASLRKLRTGTRDLYTRLADLFRSGSTASLAQLQAALDARDFDAAGGVCHKLASSAANVGALAYSKQLRRLEQLCIANDVAGAAELNDLIQSAHPALLDALLSFTMRASA